MTGAQINRTPGRNDSFVCQTSSVSAPGVPQVGTIFFKKLLCHTSGGCFSAHQSSKSATAPSQQAGLNCWCIAHSIHPSLVSNLPLH